MSDLGKVLQELDHFFAGHSDRSILMHILCELKEIKEIMADNQSQLDAAVALLGTVATDLPTEFQALKDQIAAGTPPEQLDFTGLDSIVSSLQGIDSANVVATVPPVAPADPTV